MTANPTPNIQRQKLLDQPLAPGMHVNHVEMHRLTIAPGASTGLHRHPGPVISIVIEGEVRVQLPGEEPRLYCAGEAILEPGDQPIPRFDNASADRPAVFVATYLLGQAGVPLIEPL
jgi:quercetin dioxygenase-like cupin family protein